MRHGIVRRALSALLGIVLAISTAQAAEKPETIPRFASLRADVVNLRIGPGDRYPVEWVYHRKGLPVEIIAQLDQWRRVRDSQGTEGWVHQRLVAPIRNVIVQGAQRVIYTEADPKSPPVAKLDAGVIAHLLECRKEWCRIEAQSVDQPMRGWLVRDQIWGVYPDEVVR
jgi:SH3-like domain-containing protein